MRGHFMRYYYCCVPSVEVAYIQYLSHVWNLPNGRFVYFVRCPSKVKDVFVIYLLFSRALFDQLMADGSVGRGGGGQRIYMGRGLLDG